MEIFENIYDWILGHKNWYVRAVKLLNALLMLAATVLSGVAAWYSCRAAEEANATAKQANATAAAAYKFTIRSANDANALQQPSLSVTSGKIVEEETIDDGAWKMKSTRYSVELHVLNSGLRDAAAVWIALGDDRGSAWTQAQKPATISKGQDLLVNFEVKTSDTQLKDLRALTVSLRSLDMKPDYEFDQLENSTKSFRRICSTPKVQVLTILRPRGESGMTEATLTMGASIQLEDLDKGNWTPELYAARNSLKAMSTLDASECKAAKPR